MEVLNADDEMLWAYTPAPSEDGFWSANLRGPRIKVRVVSTQAGSPQQVVVDVVAVPRPPPVEPQAIHGKDDREKITDQPDEVKGLGKAVARIRYVADNGKLYVCTGFLITADLFMTNEHCPRSEPEWRSALIDFDYDAANVTPKNGLQETRRLMLGEELDAVSAGHRVGYEDPAYFSRDYKKQFGAPLKRDIARLHGSLEPGRTPAMV